MRKKKHTRISQEDFMKKTDDILNDSSWKHIVAWLEVGKTFEISDVVVFTSTLLPKYFQHSNFSRFLYYLRLYGFRKQSGRYVFFRPDAVQVRKNRAIREPVPEPTVQELVKHISLLEQRQSGLKHEITHILDHHNSFKETQARLQEELRRFRERSDRIGQVLSQFYSFANVCLGEVSTDFLLADKKAELVTDLLKRSHRKTI